MWEFTYEYVRVWGKNRKHDILCVIGGKLKLYDKLEMLIIGSMNRCGSREMVNYASGCAFLGFLVGARDFGIFPETDALPGMI